MKNLIKEMNILHEGGIGIFPTDTAFGIGCRIDNKEAVMRLFTVKKRAYDQAVPVLVTGSAMVDDYALSISDDVNALMKTYWPGALTIILNCHKGKVLELVRGSGNTLGFRMPNHSVPLALVQGLGVPLIGTSANFHGQKTPYVYEDLDKDLLKKVDFVIKGDSLVHEASTIVDCTQKSWKVVREGAIHLSI